MKKIIYLIAFITFSNFCLSQELPDIIPPSPEAASLGKYLDVPISHYTGLPNISIPLTSFNVGKKKFPVSISYHSRGIKVEEIASRVGTGWNLNAGGQISRQVRDKPDDLINGLLNGVGNKLSNTLASDGDDNFFINHNTRINYVTEDLSNQSDHLLDQFNFQVSGGVSGKFIFDYKNKTPLFQKYDDMDIQYGIMTSPFVTKVFGIGDFVITDKDGYKYYYGLSKDGLRRAANWDKNLGNYTFSKNGVNLSGSESNNYFNSWLLMDIESPNGDLASFYYNEEVSNIFRRSYDKMQTIPVGSYTQNFMVNVSNKIRSHQYQLTEIRYDIKGNDPNVFKSIKFNAIDEREDLNNSKELDNIEIYNHMGEVIKSFNFNHTYTQGNIDDNINYHLLNLNDDECSKRLFLNSITEVGRNDEQKPPYTFYYNEQLLPHRFTNSQDFWGYFNGANNGQYLRFFDNLNEVNRKVDTIKSMAGLLEKITYPTGGSVKFTYEHNKGKLGSEYSNINFPSINPINIKNIGINSFSPFNDEGNYHFEPFTVSESDIDASNPSLNLINVTISIEDDPNNYCSGPNIQTDCMYEIYITGTNLFDNPVFKPLFKGNEEFTIPPGNYEIRIGPKDPNYDPRQPRGSTIPTPLSLFSGHISFSEPVISESNMLYASGKRIRKIEYLDSDQNIISHKTYEYKNSEGQESGVILGMPFFATSSHNHVSNTGVPMIILTPSVALPGSNKTSFQNNSVGYEKVIEYFGDKFNNVGKVEYQYLIIKDGGLSLTYPITPPIDNQWIRGLPLSIKYKKKIGVNNYKIVKSSHKDYSFTGSSSSNYLSPIPSNLPIEEDLEDNTDDPNLGILYETNRTFFRIPLVTIYYPGLIYGQTSTLDDPHYKTFHMTGGTLDTKEIRETHYDENENPTLTKTTTNDFNYNSHYQPARVTTVGRDGVPVVQENIYTSDLSGALYDKLKSQNRIIPIETKKFKDHNTNGIEELNETLFSTFTQYHEFNDGSIIEPISISTSKGTANSEERIQFHKYDNKGNPLEVSKADGTRIIYVWGYNDTQPIAKLINASYEGMSPSLENTISAAKTASDNDFDEASEGALRTALQNLRDHPDLLDSQITTYTYDPLIGVTSITDPRGQTVYYFYDDFNRLEHIEDEDGNIIEEYDYHYRTPQN